MRAPKTPYAVVLASSALISFGAIVDAGGSADVRRWSPPESTIAAMSFFAGDPAGYREFGVGALTWGADPAYVSDDWLRREIEMARDAGVALISANVDVITATSTVLHREPDLQATVMRDLDDRPIVVPWFSSVQTDGVRTWIGCTNHPRYQEHLQGKLRRSVELGANALHLDTPEGSHRLQWGGCFCDTCTDAFRAYARSAVPPGELEREGIALDPEFNYRCWLRRRHTPESFAAAFRAGEHIPLLAHYARFQRQAFARFVEQMRAALEAEFGRGLPLSVNAYDLLPESLEVVAASDFLTAEIVHGAGGRSLPGRHTLFALKLASGMGRRVFTTASGWDWAHVRDRNEMDLVRFWIAQAYACGHHFMVPRNQWIISDGEQESRFYTPPPEESRTVYRFIREHGDLLDGATDAADVALIVDLDRLAAGESTGSAMFAELVDAGQAVQLVPAQSGRYPALLRGRELPEARVILAPVGLEPDPATQAWMKKSEEAGSRVEFIRPGETAARLGPSPARTASGTAFVVPRKQIREGRASWLYHVLNTSHDPQRARIATQTDVELFAQPVPNWGGRRWKATWYRPGAPCEDLAVESAAGGLRVVVPRLEVWGILELVEKP